MPIVITSPRPKPTRKRTPAQPIQLQQALVIARKPGRRVCPEAEADPEADARVRAFFAKTIRPPNA